MRAAVKTAKMSAAAHAADVGASTKSTHVSATAETSAVTAATSAVTATTSATTPRVGCADGQHRGKRGRGQYHQYPFHRKTPST
jgi:hypothetical protein